MIEAARAAEDFNIINIIEETEDQIAWKQTEEFTNYIQELRETPERLSSQVYINVLLGQRKDLAVVTTTIRLYLDDNQYNYTLEQLAGVAAIFMARGKNRGEDHG